MNLEKSLNNSKNYPATNKTKNGTWAELFWGAVPDGLCCTDGCRLFILRRPEWPKATETEPFTDKQQALRGSAAQYILGRCGVTVACCVLTTPVWVCRSETRERSTRLNKCGWPISMATIFNAGPQTLWPRVISRSVATPFLKSRSPCQDLLDYGVTVKATGWLGSRTHGQSQPARQTSLPCSRVRSVHEWASVSPKHVDKVYRKSLSQCREQSELHVKSAHSLVLDRLPLCCCLVFNWGKSTQKKNLYFVI